MIGKDISLCWSGFRRKQILRAVHISCREKHGLRWLLEAVCGNLGFWADRQSWWEHLNCWWELAVTAKSGYCQGRKEKRIKKVKIQGSTLLLFKTKTLQPQHEAATADWFITAKLWWLRCRAEVNQTRCNSKYRLQKTQISSFSNGSCPPFPAWKRVDQSL